MSHEKKFLWTCVFRFVMAMQYLYWSAYNVVSSTCDGYEELFSTLSISSKEISVATYPSKICNLLLRPRRRARRFRKSPYCPAQLLSGIAAPGAAAT